MHLFEAVSQDHSFQPMALDILFISLLILTHLTPFKRTLSKPYYYCSNLMWTMNHGLLLI